MKNHKTLSRGFFIMLLFFPSLSMAQEDTCYCYENEKTSYVEWLYFKHDSVVVAGFKNKTCQDGFDRNDALKWAREKDNLFAVQRNAGEISFLKFFIVENELINLIFEYHYTGRINSEGIEVKIEYSPASFQDALGPPERYYKRI